jgi:hypothetical protein
LAILASQRACMRVVIRGLAAVLLEFPAHPVSFNALSVLDIGHKVYGAISANTPNNTPSVIGWPWT